MSEHNCFSVIELVAAFTAIGTAYDQLTNVTTSCVGFRFFGITLMLIGVGFLILGIISRSALSESNEKIMLMKHICCSIPLMLVLVALGMFAVAVSFQGGGKAVPGRSYKVFEVESYSKWMQNKIHANWDAYYKQAVVKNKDEFVCAHYDFEPFEFEVRADPAFKSGCCRSPRGCKLCSFNNQTSSQRSIKLENGDHCSDDCNRWDADPNTLCFDCQSCKAGFLQDLTKSWFPTGLVLVFLGLILLAIQIADIGDD